MSFLRQGYDSTEKSAESSLGFNLFSEPPTLEIVVRELYLGNNRDIRSGVFRIKARGSGLGLIKTWPRVKDKSTIINNGDIVCRGNGRTPGSLKRIRVE